MSRSTRSPGEQGRRLRYASIFAIDAILIVCSFYFALFARFEGKIPPAEHRKLGVALLILVPLRLALSYALGLHRWSFRMSGFHEAIRLSLATIAGSGCLVGVFYFLQEYGPPRSVILLEFFLTTSALAVFRFSPRLASGWYVDRFRTHQEGVRRTLIVGAGSAGDLLLRDLLRSREHVYNVVGFVDDDPRKVGTYLGGKLVLGSIESIPEQVQRHGIEQLLISIPRLSAERIRTILGLCANLKIHYKIIPVSFAYLNDRIAASMLHDLSPEDLLPRDQALFDTEEIRSLIVGKRILVTGAAGSIGSEIARQVSRYAPASLVLVDINENDLYFLFRELREERPEVPVYVQIADIRDGDRLQEIGRDYRPQYVFHAAAHKHVPLMEFAPGEAVKNNVFGTLNVAGMADHCGAECFVFVSTDKAVHPTSVMGASKRIAEMIVRDFNRSSATRFTAVRFGNVLGSSGSVVPLFRRQIERGGPVTVSHPECSRYFMTVSEAVGLVLLAGLGGYGDLCMLDMGEAMNILDLARHMITMAGLVPGEDVRIEFTGLRPGEKLREDLLTEEEEESRTVRQKIHAVRGATLPEDFHARCAALRSAAEGPDPLVIFRELRSLVPTFQHPALGDRTQAGPDDNLAHRQFGDKPVAVPS